MLTQLVISDVKNRPYAGSICLIIPPSIFLLDDRVFMSLGILRIAAVLEQSGIDVDVLDLSGIKNFTEVIRDYSSIRTDMIYFALTATTPQMPGVSQIISVLRKERPDARILLGGPHVTLVNAAYKNEVLYQTNGRATTEMACLLKMFDVIVAGDGERAIFQALGQNSPKLIDADDKKSDLFLTNSILNNLPFPARHLVDVGSYHYSIDGVPALSIIAQLGCPFECGFCGGRSSPMLRKIRTRTSQNIVEEMLFIYHKYGIRGFMMYDDELNVNPNMVELMELIASAQKDLGVEWRLRGFIKAELFTENQARAMYKAGFRWILTGFESGSPKILRNINKKATREDNTECLRVAYKNNLKVKALMSVGHPGETNNTLKETKEWLLEEKPDDFDVSIITCYPGTPYYDEAKPVSDSDVYVYTHPKSGDKLYQFDIDHNQISDYYKGDPDGGYKAYVYTDELSPADLVRSRDDLECDVRSKLGIPFNRSAKGIVYEHSMGQQGSFPLNILRTNRKNHLLSKG